MKIALIQWQEWQKITLLDLTVTSPPYDNLRTYKGFEFDWKKQ